MTNLNIRPTPQTPQVAPANPKKVGRFKKMRSKIPYRTLIWVVAGIGAVAGADCYFNDCSQTKVLWDLPFVKDFLIYTVGLPLVLPYLKKSNPELGTTLEQTVATFIPPTGGVEEEVEES